MPQIVVCTAVYPAVLPFLAAYGGALERAAASCSVPVHILFALDAVSPEAVTSSGFPAQLSSTAVDASGLGVAGVRRRLLHAADPSQADVLVFTDADDMLEPDAFSRHLAALETADFSFSDMIPIDRAGHVVGPTFFAGADVPLHACAADDLLDRNFVGFTASAVRNGRVPRHARDIPDGLAAADWWFFSMLLREGLTGQQTDGAVVRYRQHGANTLGPRPDPSLAAFRRRCELARDHYGALPQDEAVRRRRQATSLLLQALDTDPEPWRPRIAAACAEPGVWFEDVSRMAAAFLPMAMAAGSTPRGVS